MKPISDALNRVKDAKRQTNNSTEHQVFGVYLGDQLEDSKHYSLYIKLAKTYPRGLLEEALSYVKNYPSAKSKGKLYMWRLKQLKQDNK